MNNEITVLHINPLSAVGVGESIEFVISIEEQLVTYCGSCGELFGKAEDLAESHRDFHDFNDYKRYKRYAVYGTIYEEDLKKFQVFFNQQTFTSDIEAFLAFRNLEELAQAITK